MQTDEIAAIVFLDIAVIVVVARLMGGLFRRFHQPAVIGEIVAGILLGPTLLGRLPGDPTKLLFPPEVRPFLSVVAQLGLVIFMFIVGMEFDLQLIRGHERSAAVISISSVILPFALGCLLASGIYASHGTVAGETVDRTAFALFIGASMSVTAFPVLARILAERGIHRTPLGSLTLAAAAVDDVLAWSMLAVVVAVVEAKSPWDLPRILLLSAGFLAVMLLVVKPKLALLNDRFRQAGRLTPGILSVVLVGILLSAFATSKIGIHAIFGAFVFGVVMPRKDAADLMREILERLEQVSVLLLLPVFFIATGLGVDIGGIGLGGFGELALVILVACAGKLVGATAAARIQGISTRRAAAIGVLMNTRGLTELVILNIGLSKGLLDPSLFTMLVIMAVVTTVMTQPLLRVVYPPRMLSRDIAEAERARLGIAHAYRVLAVLDDPSRDEYLVDTAVSLTSAEAPSEIVLSRLLPRPRSRLEVGSGLAGELSQMTLSLSEMEPLAAGVRARGVACLVLSRFADDPARELLEQAVAVDAGVVLVPGPAGSTIAGAAMGGVAGQVIVQEGAIAPGGATGAIAAVPSGRQAQAVLEVALRLAVARRLPLVIFGADGKTSARRLRHTVEAVRRLGVECSVIDTQPDASPPVAPARFSVVVRAGGEPLAGTAAADHHGLVITVRAAEDSDGAEFERLVERLAAEQAGESNAGRPTLPPGPPQPVPQPTVPQQP